MIRLPSMSFLNTVKSNSIRNLATVGSAVLTGQNHKIVVIGAGSAGLNASHQLLRSGKFKPNDIAIVDPSNWHHYQPGWTLVGAGLKTKEELRRPTQSLIASDLKYYDSSVESFSPKDNHITLKNGDKISYEQLIVCPGIGINYGSIKGLPESLDNPDAMVSSIYGYETCEKVFQNMKKFDKGKAIFTQPSGIVKCAGAPQKIMWLALDHWKTIGTYKARDPQSPIGISFATALPTMFGAPKYSKRLEKLREERGVEGLFQHDLSAIEGNTATFIRLDTKEKVQKHFDFLHVVPKMGPHAFVENSELANEAGLVDVDESTTRHKKYPNIWSIGDASSLPTSKTAAAITAETPVMVHNLLQAMEGKDPTAIYDGYTSCPIPTEYGKLMLAEFKYGGEPKETFSMLGIDQGTPRRAFYYLKKDFFPWVYYKSMVKGTWGGAKGWISRPPT
ncbi:sulfide,quinone oxidoreductase/flavo-binding protein [Microthyrium microscopicum]|uniref:Sulfide,quinone oxidoreductase/flavo-binding protein n=1 Tax=Microthyrium microscopicum TaxID=703497 RepID=A0A6A6UBZ3_9PEZI|nr:sulfide,quinone oxidoreductase/flavo-binding protein [Microthyrium microscopicum]